MFWYAHELLFDLVYFPDQKFQLIGGKYAVLSDEKQAAIEGVDGQDQRGEFVVNRVLKITALLVHAQCVRSLLAVRNEW